VLLNLSGRAVIALAFSWRYISAAGKPHTSRFWNLGSSTQMDVLSGQSGVTRDPFAFILPGSKRLITGQGIFGNNLDVVPPESFERLPGFVGSRAGGGRGRQESRDEIAEIALTLDFVVLEDGLCPGPDEWGLFE